MHSCACCYLALKRAITKCHMSNPVLCYVYTHSCACCHLVPNARWYISTAPQCVLTVVSTLWAIMDQ